MAMASRLIRLSGRSAGNALDIGDPTVQRSLHDRQERLTPTLPYTFLFKQDFALRTRPPNQDLC